MFGLKPSSPLTCIAIILFFLDLVLKEFSLRVFFWSWLKAFYYFLCKPGVMGCLGVPEFELMTLRSPTQKILSFLSSYIVHKNELSRANVKNEAGSPTKNKLTFECHKWQIECDLPKDKQFRVSELVRKNPKGEKFDSGICPRIWVNVILYRVVMRLGQKILTLLLRLGRVRHLWFESMFGKFSLKISNFSIFSLWIEKSLWFGSKMGLPLIYCMSKVCSVQVRAHL